MPINRSMVAIRAAAGFSERWPSAVAHLVDPAGTNASRERGWQEMLASLDRLSATAFVVSGDGVVQQLNECAQAFLAGDDSVRVTGAQLRLSDPALNATLETALRKATQAPGRSSLFPVRGAKNQVFEVNVSPLGRRSDAAADPAPSLALVVIVRPRPDAERIARRMGRLYGLTEAEARVMAALALGETVEQIAAAYRVRVSTVRAQVRSLFEKTGVHRQTDLVRIALIGTPLFIRSGR